MKKIVYSPDHGFKLGRLVIGTVFGLIIGFLTGKVSFFFILPLFGQYQLVIYLIQVVLYPTEMRSLKRLVTAAHLTDKADNHTMSWYRASAVLTVSINTDYYLLTIDANGISNGINIDKLSNQVGAAFHHSAYLIQVGNGYATYRIDLSSNNSRVNDYDF